MGGIGGYGGRRLAKRLSRVGLWSFALQRLAAREERVAAQTYEQLGYPAIWMPESLGSKEVMAHAALLLNATDKVLFATGIANIHARDPMAMANGAKALGEAFPDRFVLGIGVSHAPSVATRGGDYGKPARSHAHVPRRAWHAAPYAAPEPDRPVPLILAALGPKMLELSAERADGAHPYFVPVEHTAHRSRSTSARSRCLATELDGGPDDRSRSAAPAHRARLCTTTWPCRTTPTTCGAWAGPTTMSPTTAAIG